MVLLAAKDSGYGDYKGFVRLPKEPNGGISYSFPATVAPPTGIPGGTEMNEVNALDDLVIEYRGRQYWVGNKAFANRNRTMNLDTNKLQTETEIIKLLAGLGYVSQLTDKKEFKLVTGIPVDQYNHYKNIVTNSWTGPFNITFRGKQLELRIAAVKAIAQGAGVYYDLALGFDKVLDTDFFGKRVLIFDMGTKTTNVVPMLEGQYLNDMALTVWAGVSNLYLNLRELLMEKYGLTYDLPEINQIARQGYCLYKGERYPIREEITKAAEPVIEKIIADTQTKIDLARDVEAVVFASGGACITPAAHLFETRIRKYVNDFRIKADPLSNVRGYAKCGNFLEQLGKF